MTKNIDKLNIDLDGIGHTLSDNKLLVPIYQRSYAWEEKHVNDLYNDIFTAIRNSEDEYFIGSIVISSHKGKNEVIDGQQRLATISILIAAIRDYFVEKDDMNRADDLQNKYLSSRDIRTQEIIPSLSLNNNDHNFYYKHVVLKPKSEGREVESKRESHDRIKKAYSIARRDIRNFVSTTNNPTVALLDLCEFIDEHLKVIVVKVPNHANAYTIFETLNDRGLDLAISDLLKNFLLGQSDDRINEVQASWTEMYSILENTENEELVVTFFRQYWSSIYGLTREREMYNRIKEKVTSKQKAVDLALNLVKSAKVYVSLIDTNQSFWNDYSSEAKTHMASLNMFGMIQVRPLLLSIISNFSIKETEKALKFLVSASVRFLIHGGLGGGALETQYSERAKEISNKDITTTSQLLEKMRNAIPTDSQFLESFKTASVSKQYLARYYLIVLEKCVKGEEKPELIPNADTSAVNLEHILPKSPDASGWTIDPEKHKLLVNRIGNLAILSSKLNSDIGNSSFNEKKEFYKKSDFVLTKEISSSDNWTQEEIIKRQEKLAGLATKAWPLK
jgi:uncharacterized protein with ParB-like and HNH nuclease domain